MPASILEPPLSQATNSGVDSATVGIIAISFPQIPHPHGPVIRSRRVQPLSNLIRPPSPHFRIQRSTWHLKVPSSQSSIDQTSFACINLPPRYLPLPPLPLSSPSPGQLSASHPQATSKNVPPSSSSQASPKIPTDSHPHNHHHRHSRHSCLLINVPGHPKQHAFAPGPPSPKRPFVCARAPPVRKLGGRGGGVRASAGPEGCVACVHGMEGNGREGKGDTYNEQAGEHKGQNSWPVVVVVVGGLGRHQKSLLRSKICRSVLQGREEGDCTGGAAWRERDGDARREGGLSCVCRGGRFGRGGMWGREDVGRFGCDVAVAVSDW